MSKLARSAACAEMAALQPQPLAVPQAFTDADFVLESARDNGTVPRMASVRVVHAAPGTRVVSFCVWLDHWPENKFTNHIGSLTASAYVGSTDALLAWARSSELVRRAVRNLR